ncbi:hypothetical protein [Devosia sp. MC521]|uniref:hypothetical protein n=1 Tax=Devosia sp. MC521 TaxID=2759954 RepID=UPI0015FA0F03|nr:hypothetical protein [Devosia sp. MC521]MBJ6986083.1 hypothetical protein [Devosia sp. MC521]QMW61452.1 hypothetical protein H4N61_10720 [Devosia sp. MC521]
MRIWIVSDLHMDSTYWVPDRIPPHDVMIIAGDVHNSLIETILELHKIALSVVRSFGAVWVLD